MFVTKTIHPSMERTAIAPASVLGVLEDLSFDEVLLFLEEEVVVSSVVVEVGTSTSMSAMVRIVRVWV